MLKIGIKAYFDIYIMQDKGFIFSHCSPYYQVLFREIFRKLDCICDFIGERKYKEINNEYENYDYIFFWGLESFLFDKEYSMKILKNDKVKKIAYFTCMYKGSESYYFNNIFSTDVPFYNDFYKTEFPNIKSKVIPFAAPFYNFVDKENEILVDDSFKIIYTGIITDRYLNILNKLADEGETIYLGGIYLKTGETGCRHFTQEEISKINPKINLINNNNVNFIYGSHFKWLKNMDLGLSFYPNPNNQIKAVNSKIVDYLICGLPCLVEDCSPNSFLLKEYDCGETWEWNNYADLLEKIKLMKKKKYDKIKIQENMRKYFDPLNVGKLIIEELK